MLVSCDTHHPSGSIPLKSLAQVELPMVAAGVWQYSEAEAEASVRAALEVGFVAIDTAYDYGNQKGVARALQGLDRLRYFLITKVRLGLVPAKLLSSP